MSSFNRISYRITSFGTQIWSLWPLLPVWRFLLSPLQNWEILMILPFSNFVFSVFQNTKKYPATRDQNPKHLVSKNRDPKTRTPNAETRKTKTQKLGCGILRDAWFSQSEISNQWCLRLFKNVSKKVLLYENWNPGQNIWHKVTKYSKIGQDFKNVISDFACFLTAIANV